VRDAVGVFEGFMRVVSGVCRPYLRLSHDPAEGPQPKKHSIHSVCEIRLK